MLNTNPLKVDLRFNGSLVELSISVSSHQPLCDELFLLTSSLPFLQLLFQAETQVSKQHKRI